MAKKKLLSAKKLPALAERLRGTRLNVYRVVSAEPFNCPDWDDSDFDRLRKIEGVFRCEECGYWLDEDEADEDFELRCKDCVDRLNEGEDEE